VDAYQQQPNKTEAAKAAYEAKKALRVAASAGAKNLWDELGSKGTNSNGGGRNQLIGPVLSAATQQASQHPPPTHTHTTSNSSSSVCCCVHPAPSSSGSMPAPAFTSPACTPLISPSPYHLHPSRPVLPHPCTPAPLLHSGLWQQQQAAHRAPRPAARPDFPSSRPPHGPPQHCWTLLPV
jgi:hypothetical protein